MVLRVGWHREHFLSPLLQLAEQDQGKTFTLVECPGGTGDMQAKLKNDEIDVCIGAYLTRSAVSRCSSAFPVALPIRGLLQVPRAALLHLPRWYRHN